MSYPNAAAGLKTVYQAKLVGLISIVLLIVPIVQIFAVAAMMIAGFLALVGLYQCRKDDKGYRAAFILVIAGLVADLASELISGTEGIAGVCGNILSMADGILSLASLYFVCITTNRLLKEVDAAGNLIDRGIVVWKLNVICTVILIVCYLLRMIPGDITPIIAGYLAIFAVIAQIVGILLYIQYLRSAYRTLEAAIPQEDRVQQMM